MCHSSSDKLRDRHLPDSTNGAIDDSRHFLETLNRSGIRVCVACLLWLLHPLLDWILVLDILWPFVAGVDSGLGWLLDAILLTVGHGLGVGWGGIHSDL